MLKLIVVAVIVFSSSVAMANKPANKTMVKAKKEVQKEFKKVLTRNYITEDMKPNTAASIVVFYQINEANNIEILKTVGSDDQLEEKIETIFARNPVEGPVALKGNIHKLKLRIIKEM